MNYQRIYSELIIRAKNRSILPNEYTENHHILPESMYPEYAKENWNLVRLFPEEHLTAHLLLARIHKNKEMVYAANMMTSMRRVNNKKYGWVKRRHSELMKMRKGIPNPAVQGDKNPAKRPEVREKMRKPKSEQGRENIRKAIAKQDRKKENNSFYGKTHTKENLEKAVENRKLNNGGNYHPNGNRTAKLFRFTSPNGEQFDVFNGASKFAEKHNINFKLIRSRKGESYYIKPGAGKVNNRTRNSVGWSVIEIEKD